MARKKIDTIVECVECDCSKINTEFYQSNNVLYKNIGFVPICKKCIAKIYEDLCILYNDKITALLHLCIFLNVPFDEETAKKFIDDKNDILQIDNYLYSMTKIRLKKKDCLTDEDNVNRIKSYIKQFGLKVEDSDFVVTKEMISRWGSNYDIKDIMFLEKIYNDLIESYGGSQFTARSLYCDYAQNELHKQQALASGKDDVFIKYQTAQSKLMADARLKPAQETDSNEDDFLVGLFIKKIEENQPVPEADESFKDVDGIKKIISDEYIRTLKRSIGGVLK